MREEDIREGDIVEIDYISEFTKEHINEGKALVIWKGNNSQPLVRKLNTEKTGWTCYEHIAKVVGHVNIEFYMDNALRSADINEEKEDPDRFSMGVTLTANNSRYSFDMGAGGFFNLRANIADLFDEQFGEHYRRLLECRDQIEYEVKRYDKRRTNSIR